MQRTVSKKTLDKAAEPLYNSSPKPQKVTPMLTPDQERIARERIMQLPLRGVVLALQLRIKELEAMNVDKAFPLTKDEEKELTALKRFFYNPERSLNFPFGIVMKIWNN